MTRRRCYARGSRIWGLEMKKVFFGLLFGLLVSGCATTVGMPASSTVSGFDGSRFIDIPPHGTQCRGMMICPIVGASWNTKASTPIITVGLANKTIGIRSASLNIDGRVVELGQASTLTKFENFAGIKQSTNVFPIAMDDLVAIGASKRTWLRVVTMDGVVEDAIIDEKGDSKAFHAIKRFVAEAAKP